MPITPSDSHARRHSHETGARDRPSIRHGDATGAAAVWTMPTSAAHSERSGAPQLAPPMKGGQEHSPSPGLHTPPFLTQSAGHGLGAGFDAAAVLWLRIALATMLTGSTAFASSSAGLLMSKPSTGFGAPPPCGQRPPMPLPTGLLMLTILGACSERPVM